MTKEELTKIREDKKLSKGEFAKHLGITPMLLGRYEKGSCAIPDAINEKLEALSEIAAAAGKEIKEEIQKAEDKAVAEEIEVKKSVRKAGRRAKETKEKVEETVKEAIEEKAVAEEIEVKKKARRSARKAKETKEKLEENVKEAVEEKVVAEEIEVKKKARKAGKAIKKTAGIPNIIIQSPMGGYITPEDIAKKVPKNTADVYVKVDENKLYYVRDDGETGDVDIWD